TNSWHVLHTGELGELNLESTLRCGQVFTWKKVPQRDSFVGVVQSNVVEVRQQNQSKIVDFTVHRFAANASQASSPSAVGDLLRDYFQLQHRFKPLLAQWQANDANLRALPEALHGVRLIRQRPFECTLSFICSQNNNVARIAQMIDRLCVT